MTAAAIRAVFRIVIRTVKIAGVAGFGFAASLPGGGAVAGGFNAGFVVLRAGIDAPEIGIWYPSGDSESEGEIGPFRAVWAWEGAPAGGVFPVIVFSHGRGGRFINHRQTAAALARAGYVVVAPQHTTDGNIKSRDDFVFAAARRAEELRIALAAAKSHPVIGGIADENRIGAAGYSLGTLTALMAAGATPSMRRIREHCITHGEADANFCGNGWRAKTARKARAAIAWLKEKGVLKPKKKSGNSGGAEFSPVAFPTHFRAIALIAPMGAPFAAEPLRALNSNIALFRLGGDEELRHPWHAEHLRLSLGARAAFYGEYPGVHHYAFISPFPKWLLETEHIPAAADPEGFNRGDFIRRINADITGFFLDNL